jgi:MFS family permease
MRLQVDVPHYKWLLVAVLFLVASLNYADRGILTAVFPLLSRDLGMSDMALAAIGSFFLWGYALCSPLAGFMGDRFSRSTLVTVSVAAWSLVTVLTGLVNSSGHLLTMRVLLGVTESLYVPASLALIADHHPARSRATAMAIHLTGFYAGVVFGGTVAGFLGERYGWRLSLFVLGGIGLLLAVLCQYTLRDKPPQSKVEVQTASTEEPLPLGKALLQLARTPSYLVLLVEAMLLAIGVWIFANWLPLYFNETFHMSLGGAGFSGTFPVQAGSMLGILAGGYFSDKIAQKIIKRRMLLHGLCYLAGAPLLLAFIWIHSYGLLVSCIFAFWLLRTLGAANANPLLCDLLPAKSWSTAIGLMNTSNCLAGGAGILIAGYLKRDFGLAGVFAGISGITLLASVLLLLGYRFFLDRDLASQHHWQPPETQVS